MHRVSLICRGLSLAVRVRPVSLLYHSTPSYARQSSNVVTSPLPPIEHSPLDLYRHVYQDFPKFGKRTAVVDGITGQQFSYNQIDELTSKFSSGLNRNGFKPGDVLSIVAPNGPAYPVIFFGTIASGGIVSTCNPGYTSDELSFQFKNSDAKIVATVMSLLPTVEEAINGTNVEKIIVIDGDSQRSGDSQVFYQSLIEDSGSLFNPVSSDVHSTAVLPYSSGTTGLPKGVMLTHHSISSNISQLNHPELVPLGEQSKLLGLLPFFHIYGMVVIMFSSMRFGSQFVTMPSFEPESFLRILQDHKITFAHLVPPLVLFLAKHPLVENYDLSSLDEILSGAAPAGGEMVMEAVKRTGVRLIRQGYGLTETSPVTHVMPASIGNAKPDSIGVCVRSLSTKIVDPESGSVLGEGEQGELWVTGPNVMKGYLNRPEATEACMTPDGWFKTGDVGELNIVCIIVLQCLVLTILYKYIIIILL